MTRVLAEMTAPEVADAIAGGNTTVILPLGATEQHGPHLPLATDTIRAEALARGLGDVLGGALVAPVLPIGCSDEHTGFAGLLSLDHETLARVILDCARRMAGWGVRRLVLLSAHGGNGVALERAKGLLSAQVPALEVVILGFSGELREALERIAAVEEVPPEAIGLHAGEGETSELLRLRPDLVRMEHARAGYVGPTDAIWPQLLERGLGAVEASGTIGDPRLATARRGADYLAAQIGCLAAQIGRTGIGRTGISHTGIDGAGSALVPGDDIC